MPHYFFTRWMNKALPRVVLFGAALFLAGCAGPSTSASSGDTVSLMTFNVQNLFDTRDDVGKNDETYLPLAMKQSAEHKAGCAKIDVARWRSECEDWDWSEAVLAQKLKVIAEAIQQLNDGLGPDIIVFQEVENIGVLERLRSEHLSASGYLPAVLLEGPDRRGIDVAFLSRLPVIGKPSLHKIPFTGFPDERIDDTRGILQAEFRLPNGDSLTGFAVHFPAPYHPAEMREQAYGFLRQLQAALPADRASFAAGDFNTTSTEIAKQDTMERLVRPHWRIAHEMGCAACKGTHYYGRDDSWSFLDMILFAPGSNNSWSIDPASVAIANNTAAQNTKAGTPARFRLPEASGVSDHWPLTVSIRVR